jgi:hypothetical protein
VQPTGLRSAPVGSGNWFLCYLIPAFAILIALLLLANPIRFGQHIVGLIVACFAALVSIAGLLLLIVGNFKGAPMHIAGAAICAGSILLAINAIILKSNHMTRRSIIHAVFTPAIILILAIGTCRTASAGTITFSNDPGFVNPPGELKLETGDGRFDAKSVFSPIGQTD